VRYPWLFERPYTSGEHKAEVKSEIILKQAISWSRSGSAVCSRLIDHWPRRTVGAVRSSEIIECRPGLTGWTASDDVETASAAWPSDNKSSDDCWLASIRRLSDGRVQRSTLVGRACSLLPLSDDSALSRVSIAPSPKHKTVVGRCFSWLIRMTSSPQCCTTLCTVTVINALEMLALRQEYWDLSRLSDRRSSNVFSCRQKIQSERMSAASYARGGWKSPNVDRWGRETVSVSCWTEMTTTFDVYLGWMISSRFHGVISWSQQYVSTHTHRPNRNQWRLQRSEMTYSRNPSPRI